MWLLWAPLVSVVWSLPLALDDVGLPGAPEISGASSSAWKLPKNDKQTDSQTLDFLGYLDT